MKNSTLRGRRFASATACAILAISFSLNAASAHNGAPTGATQKQSLLRMLQNPDESVRKSALDQYAATPGQVPPAAIPRITQILRSTTDSVMKESALKALAAAGPTAAPAVESIIETFTDKPPIHMLVSQAKQNKRVVDLTGPSILALTRIGPAAQEAIPFLVPMLLDKTEYRHRKQLLDALEAIGPDSYTTAALMRIVAEEGRFTDTRQQAIRLIGKIRPAPQECVPLLTEIASDETDKKARQAANEALAVIRDATKHMDAQQVEAAKIAKILSKENDEASKLAALKNIKADGQITKLLVPVVLQTLNDPSPAVQITAVETLGLMGPQAYPAIPSLLATSIREANEDRRRKMFRAIARIDASGDPTIPLLSSSLDDPFKVRTVLQLLDIIGSAKAAERASEVRQRWRIKP